ncbi:MAG: hypothetical protein WCT04_17025 [Planctomycetota bacterium]
MSANLCNVFCADVLAPLIGIAPYAKCPTGIAYGKWVALFSDGMWYIELGYMNEYHAELAQTLNIRFPKMKTEIYKDGTIAQRGGPGTPITLRSNYGDIPEPVRDAICNALLTAQSVLPRKKS